MRLPDGKRALIPNKYRKSEPIFLVCLISLWANTAVPANYNDELSGAECFEVAAVYLDEWQARDEFLHSPQESGAQSVLRSPTRTFGVWVIVQLTSERVTAISRISPDEMLQVDFDTDCEPSVNRVAGLFGQGQDRSTALGDAEAEQIVENHRAGIFYSWSPHMPLSVSGYDEIESAAKSLGLTLVAVLSDHANAEFAAEQSELSGIPAQALQRNRSVELIMRDLQVHAPAILIFRDGKFVSPTLPGFRYAKDYEALISKFLD